MNATDWISLSIAAAAFLLSGLSFYTQARQNVLFAGASSAIAWRQQVFDLYDRGLERNGNIDEILRDVPRRV